MPDTPSIRHDQVEPVGRSATYHVASPIQTSVLAAREVELEPVHRNGHQRHDQRPEVAELADIVEHGDRVQLSDHARLLDRMRQLPPGRTNLIDSVRDAIARGRYESEDKLSVAIDRLIEDLDID